MDSLNSKTKLLEKLQKFAHEVYHDEVEEILYAKNVCGHYSISIDALSLMHNANIGDEVAKLLLGDPDKLLHLLNKSFFRSMKDIFYKSSSKVMMCLKKNLHVRLHSLPVCPEFYRTKIPKTKDVRKLLCISATVTRTTLVKMLHFQKEYMCKSCNHLFVVDADIHQHFKFSKPSKCPNPQNCSSTYFVPSNSDAEREQCKDYQEIRIQEEVQQLSMGTIPRFMWVILEDDLVDSCKAGQNVSICGVVKQRFHPLRPCQKISVELILHAWYVEVKSNKASLKSILPNHRESFHQFWDEHKRCPLKARNIILSNFCPQIFGLYTVKLAVALILAGGVQKVDENGTKIRGDSHLLLVGDPGTGKSQFLKYASKISLRSVLTTGIGSTNAGLTVTAIKDSGEWQLEAGALVLSDGGICCIDEFNSIREQDRASIHEAMEQQTVSVAKAGMVCKLNTKCAIIAATNPKGKLDLREDASVNLGIASPLLSRFDLILMLHDCYNEDWDLAVSSKILRGVVDADDIECWSIEKMQSYFAMIKNLKPTMTENCNKILCRYYQVQRQQTVHRNGRTTIRLLESLVRLAQAHARLMFRDEVTIQDAISVLSLMDSSIDGSGLLDSNNSLHTLFPEDPQMAYKVQLKILLKKLNLVDILQEELDRLSSCEDEHQDFGNDSHLDALQFISCDTNVEFNHEDRQTTNHATVPSKYFGQESKTISNKLSDKANFKINDLIDCKISKDPCTSKISNSHPCNNFEFSEENKDFTNDSNITSDKRIENKNVDSRKFSDKLSKFSFLKTNNDESLNTSQNKVETKTISQGNVDANREMKASQELSFMFSKDEDFDCLNFDNTSKFSEENKDLTNDSNITSDKRIENKNVDSRKTFSDKLSKFSFLKTNNDESLNISQNKVEAKTVSQGHVDANREIKASQELSFMFSKDEDFDCLNFDF